MAKENPNNSELFELAQIVKQTVPKNSLIVATTGNDPTILYLSDRKGWIPSPNAINQTYLSERAKEGAKYLVGGYNFVQAWTKSMEDGDKKNIREVISRSSNLILNSEKFFLIKL
ncbi:MAG: hypothetical protein M1G31_17655 [Pseudanabaena sp. Salubria-1]|nr:hypothetical protein [Pseudanabaena sp. Salubria-1]